MYFCDESGIWLEMARIFGRSPIGTRACGTQLLRPKGRHSIIGVLGLEGVVTSFMTEDTINGDLFLAFIKEFMCPLLKEGDVLFMDNSSIHKVSGIKEAIEAEGALLIYLPRYSPDLNPIEEMWSKVKSYLRKVGAKTSQALQDALCQAFDSVTSEDIRGWFRHAGYCV